MSNKNYNERLKAYGTALLGKNDKALMKFLDKKYAHMRFVNKQVDTDLKFAKDLKSLVFSKESFTMTFKDPIHGLSSLFADIHLQLDYLEYEQPRYIYISLELNEREWIWFEANYPGWDHKKNTLTFKYRLDDYYDPSGNNLMGYLFNYRDFPFLPDIKLEFVGEHEEDMDKITLMSPNRYLFSNYVTLDLTNDQYKSYKVSLSFHY